MIELGSGRRGRPPIPRGQRRTHRVNLSFTEGEFTAHYRAWLEATGGAGEFGPWLRGRLPDPSGGP